MLKETKQIVGSQIKTFQIGLVRHLTKQRQGANYVLKISNYPIWACG